MVVRAHTQHRLRARPPPPPIPRFVDPGDETEGDEALVRHINAMIKALIKTQAQVARQARPVGGGLGGEEAQGGGGHRGTHVL